MIAAWWSVILTNGLGFFWPSPLTRVTLKDGSSVPRRAGEREPIPNPGQPDHLQSQRLQLKVGNRDLLGFDFKWNRRGRHHLAAAAEGRLPGGAPRVRPAARHARRAEAGRAACWRREPAAIGRALPALLDAGRPRPAAAEHIEKDEIGAINYRIEQARLRKQPVDPALEQQYQAKQEDLARLMATAPRLPPSPSAPRRAEKELRTLRHLPRLRRERARLGRSGLRSTSAASGRSWPTTRASRTPRAASSRPSSAP
jgi:hypothetical protein